MKLRPTRILVWLALAGVAAAFYFALQPQPLEADFAAVVRGPLRVTLSEEGQTRVRDRYMVSAPLAGRVLRIEHEPGDPVVAGATVLATFQPSAPGFLDTRARAEAEARVNAAQASVDRARADLDRETAERDHAESELARRTRLHQDGLLADDRLASARLRADTAREAVKAAASSITVAEAELERAKTSLIQAGASAPRADRAISLRSPISGVVLRRLRESEAIVPSGEPLLEVADPEKLEIVSDMLSTDAVQIDEGDPALIEQWGGDRVLNGTVRRVEPYGFTKISALGVEEQRVNVIVDFDDVRDAWEALGDGYRVEIAVVIWEEDDVLKVPSSSLFRDGEEWAVYTVEREVRTAGEAAESGSPSEPVQDAAIAARAALRRIEVGRRNAREAQVLSGLSEGNLVIAYPGDQIQDGAEIVPRSL